MVYTGETKINDTYLLTYLPELISDHFDNRRWIDSFYDVTDLSIIDLDYGGLLCTPLDCFEKGGRTVKTGQPQHSDQGLPVYINITGSVCKIGILKKS